MNRSPNVQTRTRIPVFAIRLLLQRCLSAKNYRLQQPVRVHRAANVTVKADTSNPHAITHTAICAAYPAVAIRALSSQQPMEHDRRCGQTDCKMVSLRGLCQFLHRGNFLMREVFIRQPFFHAYSTRLSAQSVYPSSISADEYRHNYRRVGNGAGTSDTSRSDTPFSQVCSCNDHSLVPG